VRKRMPCVVVSTHSKDSLSCGSARHTLPARHPLFFR
jgi:hypothetical protein